MKMKNLFILLATITLVACSSNSSRVSSSSIEDSSSISSEESLATSDSSENEESSSSDSTSTSSNSTSSSSTTSSSSSSSSQTNTVKKTVSFLNGGFTNSSLDKTNSQTQFINWFNGDDNILASINYYGYAQLNYIGNENDSWRFSTLILGSQNSNGSIIFNFNVHVTSVKIVVQPYTKYIAYSDTYSIDKSATFIFDEEEHDLSVKGDYVGDTEKTTIECTPDANTNKFKIANKISGQRVFVHSFELTYIA